MKGRRNENLKASSRTIGSKAFNSQKPETKERRKCGDRAGEKPRGKKRGKPEGWNTSGRERIHSASTDSGKIHIDLSWAGDYIRPGHLSIRKLAKKGQQRNTRRVENSFFFPPPPPSSLLFLWPREIDIGRLVKTELAERTMGLCSMLINRRSSVTLNRPVEAAGYGYHCISIPRRSNGFSRAPV